MDEGFIVAGARRPGDAPPPAEPPAPVEQQHPFRAAGPNWFSEPGQELVDFRFLLPAPNKRVAI
eukprot:204646-Pyramimonas_sp.AAC.1